MRFNFCAAIFGLIAMFAVVPCQTVNAQKGAQDDAALIVGVESVDDILSEVSYLVGAAGFPEFVPFVTFGAGEYIKGLDKDKPAGMVVSFDGDTPVFLGFVPVSDIDDVLDTLSDSGFDIDEGDDIITLTTPDGANDVYVKEAKGYAFISDNEDNLDELPDDPAEIVGDLTKRFTVGVKANLGNIPESLREMAIEGMQEGFDGALENLEQDNEALAELQVKWNKMSIDNLVSLIEDSESIVGGMKIDEEGERISFDMDFTVKEGTKFAKQFALYKDIKSKFGGFYRDDTAMKMHFAGGYTQEDIDKMVDIMKDGRDAAMKAIEDSEDMEDNERAMAKRLAGDMLDVVEATIKSGELDGAASLKLDDGKIDFIAGGTIQKAMKIQEAVKELSEIAKKEAAEQVEFKFDVEKFDGVTFHHIIVNIPDDEEEAQDIFGDELKLTAGFSGNAVYLGVGDDALASIKKAIKSSKDSGNVSGPFDMVFSAQKIVEFVGEINPDMEDMMEQMADALDESGKDKIIMNSEVDGTTQKTHFEIQEGILSLIGVAGRAFGGGFGGGDF